MLLIFFSFSILAKVMLTHKEYTHTACIWKIWWYPTGPWGPCQGLRFSALYLCQSVPPLPSLLSFFLSLQYCLASSVLHSLFHFFFLFNVYIFHLQYSIFIVQYYSMIVSLFSNILTMRAFCMAMVLFLFLFSLHIHQNRWVTNLYIIESQICKSSSYNAAYCPVTKLQIIESQSCIPSSQKAAYHRVTKLHTVESKSCLLSSHKAA